MSIININEQTKVHYDGYQYQIEYFKAGGEEVYNPATGDKTISKDKWVKDQTYHATLTSVVKRLAKLDLLGVEEFASMKDYVDAMKEVTEYMCKQLGG